MSSSAGHRQPKCHVLNFSFKKNNNSALTVLANGVRFCILADIANLKADSGPGAKLFEDYKQLLSKVKEAEDDFTRPCSLANLRKRGGSSQDSGHGTSSEEDSSNDNDSAVDLNGPKQQSSALLKQAEEDPNEALNAWMLRPLGPVFDKHAARPGEYKEQSVREWYEGITFFFKLSIENGELTVSEEEATPDLERTIVDIIPKMYVPKHIRKLDIPWYAAGDLTVVDADENIPPYAPSRVRKGNETYFLKMVDPTQPAPFRREISLLKKAENEGLHKKINIPVVKGLVGFEDSNTEMMGFLQNEIEDPTPLTKLLDSEVPQSKRDAWAQESKRVKDLLHEHKIIWGDAKADNFMVDKHDNLWIIDFGGSYTDGWIDSELMETVEGDDQGVERIVNALHDPDANTMDPNEGEGKSGSSTGNKRKVGKLNKDIVHSEDEDGAEDEQAPPRKRARREAAAESEGDEEEDPSTSEDHNETKTAEVEQSDDQNGADDSGEEQFCICSKPSSGDMVACDNEDCERQWFHFDCVGLAEAPKTRHWYCDECKDEKK